MAVPAFLGAAAPRVGAAARGAFWPALALMFCSGAAGPIISAMPRTVRALRVLLLSPSLPPAASGNARQQFDAICRFPARARTPGQPQACGALGQLGKGDALRSRNAQLISHAKQIAVQRIGAAARAQYLVIRSLDQARHNHRLRPGNQKREEQRSDTQHGNTGGDGNEFAAAAFPQSRLPMRMSSEA